MALRITPMRPIERKGLKGFGLTVFIDNSPETATNAAAAGSKGPAIGSEGPSSASHEAGESEAPLSHSSRRSSPETDKTGEVATSSPASPVANSKTGA